MASVPKFTYTGSEKKRDGASLLGGALSASLSTLTKPLTPETPKPAQPTPSQINRQDAAQIQSGTTRPSIDQQHRDHFAQSHPEYTGGVEGARTRAVNTGWVNAATELKKTQEEVDKLQREVEIPASSYLTGGTPQVATPYAPGLQVKRAREEQGSELSRAKDALKETQSELTAWTMLRNEDRVQQAAAAVTKDPFAVTTALKKVREMPLDKQERRRAEQDVRGALYASILQSNDFKSWDGSYDRYGQNLDVVTSEALDKAGKTPVATEEEERLLDYLIYKSKTDPAWRDNEDLTPNQYYQWWSAAIGDPRAGRRQAEKAKGEGVLGGAKMVLNSTARSMDDAWAGLFGVERSLSADDYAVAEYRDSLEGVPGVAFDAASTVANMAPSVAVGAALGPQAGLATMAASAGGHSVQQALREGHGRLESYGYGAVTAASEALVGRLLGGISNVGGGSGVFSNILGASAENIENAFWRFAAKVGLNSADEALEELVQGDLDPVFRNIFLGENNEIKLISEDAAYDAFLALITTPFLEGPHQAWVEIDRTRTLSDWGRPIWETGVDNAVEDLDVLTTTEGETGKPMAQDVSALETQQKTASTGEMGTVGQTDYNHGESGSVVKQLASSIPELEGDRPVARVNWSEIERIEGYTMAEKARTLFARIKGIVTRTGFGDVEINDRAIKDDLSHGVGPAKAAVIPAIPEVIRKGRQIDFVKNWKGRAYDGYVFAAPVDLDGETVYVAAVVKRTSKNRFYLHEVVDSNGNIIKMGNGGGANQTSLAATGDDAGTLSPLLGISIPQPTPAVKPLSKTRS